ncbi:MAG TPA: hypothetical protein VMM93_10160 [Vicinamibacterales bacterium]|nr:hypothetical protein [Vicinamibacterales bacterium]
MSDRPSRVAFVVSNVVVWCLMTTILVVVPDQLARWIPIEIARVVGWGVAGSVWVVSVEALWRARFGPIARFFLQLVLWISAALVAIYISDQTRLTLG